MACHDNYYQFIVQYMIMTLIIFADLEIACCVYMRVCLHKNVSNILASSPLSCQNKQQDFPHHYKTWGLFAPKCCEQCTSILFFVLVVWVF